MHRISINPKTNMAVVVLRDLPKGSIFHRIRAGTISPVQYEKLFYVPANKQWGYKASYCCGREDDIGYSTNLRPDLPVVLSEEYDRLDEPLFD